MAGILSFLTGQFTTPPEVKQDLTGRTIIVTGANSGLGREAAELLLELKCSTIVLACRNVEKGEAAKEQILGTGPKDAKSEVLVFPVDMASFTSVVAFANQCKQLPRVDAAILNAGVYLNKFTLSEGYERDDNDCPHYIYIPARHIASASVVGCVVHFFTKTQDLAKPATGDIFHSLFDPEKTEMTTDRYNLSKLLVMLMVRHISKFLNESAKGSPSSKLLVMMNNIAPSFCKTGLFRNGGFGMTMSAKVMARSPQHGARTLVHAAVAGKETHGQYLSECQVKKASPFVNSANGGKTAERLWEELTAIYEKV